MGRCEQKSDGELEEMGKERSHQELTSVSLLLS